MKVWLVISGMVQREERIAVVLSSDGGPVLRTYKCETAEEAALAFFHECGDESAAVVFPLAETAGFKRMLSAKAVPW